MQTVKQKPRSLFLIAQTKDGAAFNIQITEDMPTTMVMDALAELCRTGHQIIWSEYQGR